MIENETLTPDEMDEAVAAGLRRKRYLESQIKERHDSGKRTELEEQELRFCRAGLYGIRVLADDLRGEDTPLALLDEARGVIDGLLEGATRVDKDEARMLVDRMSATIRRLT